MDPDDSTLEEFEHNINDLCGGGECEDADDQSDNDSEDDSPDDFDS